MSEPVPILFTIPNFITAGSGRAMLNIIERLDRERFAPSVCVLKKGGDLDKEVERLGIPLLEAQFTIPPRPYASLWWRAWQAARPFRQGRYQLWHSFHYSDDYTEPIIARMAGARAWIYYQEKYGLGQPRLVFAILLCHADHGAKYRYAAQFFCFAHFSWKVRLVPRGVDNLV